MVDLFLKDVKEVSQKWIQFKESNPLFITSGFVSASAVSKGFKVNTTGERKIPLGQQIDSIPVIKPKPEKVMDTSKFTLQ